MKTVILDAMSHIVSVADTDVVLGRVEDVGHPGPLQVGEVTDCLPVTDDDPSADLVAVHCSLLLPHLSPPRARLARLRCERELPPLPPPLLQLPPRRLQAGLPPQSPPGLGRAGRLDVLQGGTAAQPGVIVRGGVRADVLVLLAHVAVPEGSVDINSSSPPSPRPSPHIKSCFPGKKT